jgi:hypothetical protein
MFFQTRNGEFLSKPARSRFQSRLAAYRFQLLPAKTTRRSLANKPYRRAPMISGEAFSGKGLGFKESWI